MPQTFRDYPRMLVGICTQDFAPHTNGTKERTLCGDITAVARLQRSDHGTIGTKQANLWLWLHLEGLDSNEMGLLKSTNVVPFGLDDTQDLDSVVQYDKRRYCIPLERLKQLYNPLDIAKAKDPNLVYQPFVMVQGDPPYFFLKKPKVFDVHGLVFDKATGEYL